MPSRALSRVFAALAVLFALPTLAYPLGPDQSLFLYVGSVIRAGGLPYVDVVDIKPPLVFFLYALTPTIFAVRALDLAIAVGMALVVRELAFVLRAIARGSSTPSPGVPTTKAPLGLALLVTLGLYYGAFDYWSTAQVELTQGTLAALALVLAARNRAGWAGAAAALSFGFKPSLVALVPIVIVWLNARAAGKHPVAQSARFVGAAAVVVVVVVAPFALRDGGLARAVEVLVDFQRIYAADKLSRTFSTNWDRTGRFVWGFVLFACTALWVARHRRRDLVYPLTLALSLVVLAALNVFAQRKFLDYHWALLTPYVAAAALLALETFPSEGARYAIATAWIIVGILPVRLEASAVTNYHHAYGRHLVTTARSLALGRRPPWDLHQGGFGNDVGPLEHAAARIREAQRPGDTLCARSFRPLPYVLTGLRCPSRFPWEQHTAARWNAPFAPPALPPSDLRVRFADEHRAALERSPPTFVITFPDWPADHVTLSALGYSEIFRERSVSVWQRAR